MVPIFDDRLPNYKPPKEVELEWNTFRKGLNTLLRENEIAPEELAQAQNLMLIGQGVPTKRWGSLLYFQAGNATGTVRGLKGYYNSLGTVQLLSITDDGYLNVKDGTGFRRINGASWASGYEAYMAQLDNKVYIVNGQRELAKFVSDVTLVGFPTITLPVITGATNLSNATGTTIKSYRMTAVSNVGETLATSAFQLSAQPAVLGGLAGGTLRLLFTGVSTATGVLQGFNIYGRDAGNERFLSFVPLTSTYYDDNGTSIPKEFTFTPTADSTGGPKARFIKRFQDRLIFAGLDGDPSKVLISGRWPNHEKYDIANGGNYIKVEPDAGDDIIQIETFSDRIIVFKEHSIWQITLDQEQVGNFFVTTPVLKLITASDGAIAPRSVVAVENDVFYLSTGGVYSIGFQAQFVGDSLRTNQISLKISPYFENLTVEEMKMAVATYSDGMYIIAFPGKNEMMTFDFDRLAWMGPWTLDSTVFEKFYDETGEQHTLFAPLGGTNVYEFSSSVDDDNGVAISTNLRTKAEDFKDWTLFKNIKNLFTQFRNLSGTVTIDVRVEARNGTIVTTKSFTVTSSFAGVSGWGADLWGDALWGYSNVLPTAQEATYEIAWANLNRIGRTLQLIVRTSDSADNYELVGIKGQILPIGRGYTPLSWRK